MRSKLLVLALFGATALSGCFENPVERAAAGAAAGAIVASGTNGNVATGAIIGAGAGAATCVIDRTC